MNNTQKTKRIVCIGGGTGTFVVLRGLKNYPYNISAIVAMSDSGGSNKRIRDEFGLLPTSDIRQCLIALSEDKGKVGLLRQLFMYRFEKGEGISGMTFGNLFMAALTDILGSQEEAIKQTGKVLRISGQVIPISYTKTNLFAQYENGLVVEEEHFIDEPVHDGTLKIKSLSLKPTPKPNHDAILAVEKADLIVLGPGDLYTSLLPNLLVKGLAKAIINSKARVVYVMNLMTKFGQTYNFKASDHIKAIEKYLGKSINYVLVNNSSFPENILKQYSKMKEYSVVDDLNQKAYYRVIRKPVVSSVIFEKSNSDTLVRSLIRHDSEKLAKYLVEILES